MDYKELLERYNALLDHLNILTKENIHLRNQLGFPESELVPKIASATSTATDILQGQSTPGGSYPGVDCTSDSLSKIRLFMSLFKGREDVYAKRWENKNKGTSGYAPVCLNQWQRGICGKPKIPCSSCKNAFYAELDASVIEEHLRGNAVVGVYPMLTTVYLLESAFGR